MVWGSDKQSPKCLEQFQVFPATSPSKLLFPNFSESSMPVIVMADLSNCLNPSIGTIRCLIRRLHPCPRTNGRQ
jgi:hypothetical protein